MLVLRVLEAAHFPSVCSCGSVLDFVSSAYFLVVRVIMSGPFSLTCALHSQAYSCLSVPQISLSGHEEVMRIQEKASYKTSSFPM